MISEVKTSLGYWPGDEKLPHVDPFDKDFTYFRTPALKLPVNRLGADKRAAFKVSPECRRAAMSRQEARLVYCGDSAIREVTSVGRSHWMTPVFISEALSARDMERISMAASDSEDTVVDRYAGYASSASNAAEAAVRSARRRYKNWLDMTGFEARVRGGTLGQNTLAQTVSAIRSRILSRKIEGLADLYEKYPEFQSRDLAFSTYAIGGAYSGDIRWAIKAFLTDGMILGSVWVFFALGEDGIPRWQILDPDQVISITRSGGKVIEVSFICTDTGKPVEKTVTAPFDGEQAKVVARNEGGDVLGRLSRDLAGWVMPIVEIPVHDGAMTSGIVSAELEKFTGRASEKVLVQLMSQAQLTETTGDGSSGSFDINRRKSPSVINTKVIRETPGGAAWVQPGAEQLEAVTKSNEVMEKRARAASLSPVTSSSASASSEEVKDSTGHRLLAMTGLADSVQDGLLEVLKSAARIDSKSLLKIHDIPGISGVKMDTRFYGRVDGKVIETLGQLAADSFVSVDTLMQILILSDSIPDIEDEQNKGQIGK